MKMIDEDFQTRDLPMAAFLVTVGHPLLAATRNGINLVFHFSVKAAKDAPSYLQGARMPAREFYASLRDLKSLIHSSNAQMANMKMKEH